MFFAGAALFVAQAFGIEMSLTTQITMLLVLMATSKGIAGVPRTSLVVVAATIPSFNLPTAGLVLLVGIDAFLDMGRTMTNGIATALVAKWENELGDPGRGRRRVPAGGRPGLRAFRDVHRCGAEPPAGLS